MCSTARPRSPCTVEKAYVVAWWAHNLFEVRARSSTEEQYVAQINQPLLDWIENKSWGVQRPCVTIPVGSCCCGCRRLLLWIAYRYRTSIRGQWCDRAVRPVSSLVAVGARPGARANGRNPSKSSDYLDRLARSIRILVFFGG